MLPHSGVQGRRCRSDNQEPTPAARSFTVDAAILKVEVSKVKVKGPAKVRRGKKATYRLKITNTGNAAATGVKLKVKGIGIKSNKSVGKISGGATKKVRLKPKRPGKIKTSFKVTSKYTGGKTVKKKIRVKK